LGDDTPHLNEFKEAGRMRPLASVTPAVTCSAQSTFLTGSLPSDHGVVGNGWYFRDLGEVWFWRQSNRLVQQKKVWHLARERDPSFSCANMFWWYNMLTDVDWAVTPRPMYPADGRKLPDVYTKPSGLRDTLNEKLGMFPLFKFWGPVADITSSRWITDASLHVLREHNPTLTLVYLPHLDYNLQRLGPDATSPRLRADLREVDALAGELIAEAAHTDRRVIVLSEYGITGVSGVVHINRALRQAKLLAVREELGRELLDPGESSAFAVVDHQLAHVYVARPELIGEVRSLLEGLRGVERVLGRDEQKGIGLDHERSGELVAISNADRWFSYYYWLDPERAPDFASTVDIHRKPGYDPVELFLDPKLAVPKLSVGWRLAKKAAGFRTLMDVISSEDSSLVKGSHGRITDSADEGPLFMSNEPELVPDPVVAATDVQGLILRHLFD
jgi:predicted AlkP superfamily pyrophosphatase or phosphodiesterase